MSMFAKLTNKILGKKSDKVDKPYSDIPIFENVDSIGLPGLHTVNLANEVSLQGEDEELDDSFMMESKTPTKSALYGAKITFVPTAAAPKNLSFMVKSPVLTLASNVWSDVSKIPTTSALRGAKITFVPTAAAPWNLSPM